MTMLAKWLRKASSIFSEKPEVKPDDFGMEHFLLYHGLAGSSPENQRQFKDVRADILAALSRKNSQNLAINLKLAPLWWEEKLQRIFAEARSESMENVMDSLLPNVSSTDDLANLDPLMHADWRVRANAAAMLAYMGAGRGQDRMIASLHDTAGSGSPAFCHVARSLADYQTDTAREALAEHLLHPEPWIRVDVVNALAKWPLEKSSTQLVKAFADHHDFLDYSSVALARHHKPAEMLRGESPEIVELGAHCVLGLLDASSGTFSSNTDLLPELDLQKCLAPLLAATTKTQTATRLRALNGLSEWLDKNYHQYRLEAEGYPSQEEIAEARAAAEKLTAGFDLNATLETLAVNNTGDSKKTAVRDGIKLAGEKGITASTATLVKLLSEKSGYRDEIIEALGEIGDKSCAAQLITLARALVNMEHRTGGTLSPDPIAESNPARARTYWYILRALGNIADDQSLAFLLEAAADEAADKREEALNSMVKIWCASEGKLSRSAEVKNALQKGLADPSAQVRIRACEGTVALNLPELIPGVARLVNAQEMSVGRTAYSSLEQLAAKGHKEEIRKGLTEARGAQSNAVKVKRIDEFMHHHL